MALGLTPTNCPTQQNQEKIKQRKKLITEFKLFENVIISTWEGSSNKINFTAFTTKARYMKVNVIWGHGYQICRYAQTYKKQNLQMLKTTLVTLGWSSLCQTATSWVKAALSAAISASVLWPSSPQSSNLTNDEQRQNLC